MNYLLLVAGFGLLVQGANWLVDGASAFARKFGISPLVIGLTIVAFGTSMPEFVVNITASISGNTDIAIGNILGSNIANILLILGIAGTLYPLAVQRSTVWKEIPMGLLAAVLVAVAANDAWFNEGPSMLGVIDGIYLLSFFVIFLVYTFGISKVIAADERESMIPDKHSMAQIAAMVIGGLIGLGIGGKWVVLGATEFAVALGASEALIGLTIVAIGTSLPELFTSAIAAYKKDADIAVGNVVGSNIFNIFFVLGTSALIKPLPFSSALQIDALVTIGASLLLFVVMYIGKRHTLERWQGVGFILCYVAYITYLIARG